MSQPISQTKLNNREYLFELAKQIEAATPSDVLMTMGVPLVKQGRNYSMPCPFHHGERLQSFKLTDAKHIYKCFSCGEGGSSTVKFMQRYREAIGEKPWSFSKAVMNISLAMGYVNEEEYKGFFKRRFTQKDLDDMQDRHYRYAEQLVSKQVKIPAADAEICDKVYRIFSLTWKNETNAASVLSEEHQEKLRNIRHHSDLEMKQGFYFTMPSRRGFHEFVKALAYHKVIPAFTRVDEADLSILKGVPGFYRHKKTGKWSFNALKGVAVPSFNAKQQIIGMQVWLDNPKPGVKYLCFSSSFAQDDEELEFGIGGGTPTDVMYPKDYPNGQLRSTLFITEGRFKSQYIANFFSSISLSVPGVNSWKGVIREINTLLEKHPKQFTHIYLAYDADMAYNRQVFKQALDLMNALEEAFPKLKLVYVTWDVVLGKGMDDLLIDGHREALKRQDRVMFEKIYHTFEQEVNQTLLPLYPDDNPDSWRKIPEALKADTYREQVLSRISS